MGMISVRLEDDEVERIDALVNAEGLRSRSEAIRALITGQTPDLGCAWVAYYYDYSAVVPFGNEVEALRYAVEHDMKVIRVPYGISVQQVDRARFDEASQR